MDFVDFVGQLSRRELTAFGPVIYRIVNLRSGSYYIGSSVDLGARAQRHFRQLKAGVHHCVALQRAADKHGLSSLRLEVVEQGMDATSVLKREEEILAISYGTRGCYNSTSAALRILNDPDVRKRSADARRNSAKWLAKAGEQMQKLQTPEMRAKCIAACLQSEAFADNSRKQGVNLCRPEIKARAVAASVAARAKPVVCISRDGTERVFASSCEAARAVNNGKSQSSINAACTHGRPSLGYRWRWADGVR